MSNSRNLTADEQKELNDWLTLKGIDLNPRTRRDLSNVVNMAVLFKNANSKLVNMKNYTSHGNLEKKLLNWDTFNLNVLKKTGLLLQRPALEQLASGDLKALQSLLFHLMRIERDGIPIKSRLASPVKREQQHIINDETRKDIQPQSAPIQDASIPSEPHVKTHNQMQQNQNQNQTLVKPLPRSQITRKELINEKNEQIICALSQKVLYLENVIVEKEKRINELLDHLSTLSVRIISMQTSLLEDELPSTTTPTTL